MGLQKGSATTNAILVILVVVIVGFGVWYVMAQKGTAPTPENGTGGSLEINLGGSSSEESPN